MRRLLLLSTALIAAACGAPSPDASTPAKAPARVIPEDPIDQSIRVAQGYSLIAATMVNLDERVLANLYVPNATLTIPDSTITGAPAIARRLVQFAQANSLADFERRSVAIRILDDSTVHDSGSYVMTSKRQAKPTEIERGTYSLLWRARAGIGSWVILEEHIMPAAKAKKGAR